MLDGNDFEVPKPIGTYSIAVKTKGLLYISGQIGLDVQTSELISPDFDVQAEQVFTNLRTICIANGGNFKEILKLTVYLMDIKKHKPPLDKIMMKYFVQPYPVRTTVQIAGLPKEAKIEVDAIMRTQD